MKRSLVLRRESLAALTFDELHAVHGGAQTVEGTTCPLLRCVTVVITDNCYTYPQCTTTGPTEAR